MSFFDKLKKGNSPAQTSSTDLTALTEYPDGVVAKNFFSTVDRVVKLQGPAISRYVQRLKEKNPGKSIAEQQKQLDKQFVIAATTAGAGTGSVAAFPGIGTALSVAGIAAEAVLLLEACAAYAIASAELHGIETHNEEERRAIVLLTVAGANDKDIIAALTQDSALTSIKSLRGLSSASRSQLIKANSILGRMALRQIRKRFTGAMFRKIMPLGVGVVLGAGANRKIAHEMIDHVHQYINQYEHPTR